MCKRLRLFYLLCLLPLLVKSQAVSINTTGNLPDASAMPDIQSDSRGVSIPRMTTAQEAIRLDFGPDHSLFVGRNEGISSFVGWNTSPGYEAGLDNTLCDRNVFVGDQSGAPFFSNPTFAIAIGYKALATEDHTILPGDIAEEEVKIGIGTMTPEAKVEIRSSSSAIFRLRDVLDRLSVSVLHNGITRFHHPMWMNTNDGKADYFLSVDGEIVCEELLVENSDDWPDYVFQQGYELKSLDEVRSYIQTNGHLPGIPAAADVESDGIRVGDMQK